MTFVLRACLPEFIKDIFEFKLDGSADAALQQIEDRGYANEFLASGKAIYKVGVNISSETGTVDGWKVG